MRYAQVLDTDYENYTVVYSCQESAKYYDKETDQEIPPHAAYQYALSRSAVDFTKEHPDLNMKFTFKDNLVIKPKH